MAETFDLSTDIGRVRFLLGDVAGAPAFTDAEIEAGLSGNTVAQAVAVLRRVQLARASRAAVVRGPIPEGEAERDDATLVSGLQTLAKMEGGDSGGLPKAIFGSAGWHPSDPTARG